MTTPPTPPSAPRGAAFDANDLALLLVVIIGGFNKLSAKICVQALAPQIVVFAQAAGVALMLCAGSTLWRRQRLFESRGLSWRLVLVGLILTAQRLLFFRAIQFATVSMGAILLSTTPLWTSLLVVSLGWEALQARNWAGIGVGLGGVALVITGGSQQISSYAPHPLLGGLLMVLSAVLLAVNIAVTKNWMARWGPLRVIGGGYLFAALFALPLALLDWRAAAPTSPSAVQWSALGYTIFIAGGLGTVIWYRTVRYVGASRAAVYQFLQPVFGATSAALFVGETLTVWQIAGFAITLVGVYLARPPTTPAPTTTSPEASPTVTRRFRQ